MVEIIVRNALDRSLTEWMRDKHRDDDWFSAAPIDVKGLTDLGNARRRASRSGLTSHEKIVAELNLGF